MSEIAWLRFRASAAERITGMPVDQQRTKRQRGQLTELAGTGSNTGKAALSAFFLAEMLFVQSLSPLGVVNHTLTARSVAARWISYWAATAPGAIADAPAGEQERLARELAGIDKRRASIPIYMLLHRDGESWQDVVLTDDPSRLEADDDGVTIVVNLRKLGFRLAARAEAPLAWYGEPDA